MVDKLLDIQAVIEGRARPSNLNDDNMPFYYSKSKDEHVNILYMDLTHMLNAFKETLNEVERLKEENAELQSMPTMVVRQVVR